MSWSLQITNGDLSFGGKGLNTVSGPAKLVQDLTCGLLEPMGTDPLHPSYGSILDGGVDANGTRQEGVIGHSADDTAKAFIAAEVQRVCRAYQNQQITRNAADVAIYGRSTLTADEALLAIESVTVKQAMDHMLVNASLHTGSGSLPLAIPFSTS